MDGWTTEWLNLLRFQGAKKGVGEDSSCSCTISPPSQTLSMRRLPPIHKIRDRYMVGHRRWRQWADDVLLTARRSGRRSVGVTERRTVGRVLQLVAFGGGFLGQRTQEYTIGSAWRHSLVVLLLRVTAAAQATLQSRVSINNRPFTVNRS